MNSRSTRPANLDRRWYSIALAMDSLSYGASPYSAGGAAKKQGTMPSLWGNVSTPAACLRRSWLSTRPRLHPRPQASAVGSPNAGMGVSGYRCAPSTVTGVRAWHTQRYATHTRTLCTSVPNRTRPPAARARSRTSRSAARRPIPAVAHRSRRAIRARAGGWGRTGCATVAAAAAAAATRCPAATAAAPWRWPR